MILSRLDAMLDKKLGDDWHLLEMETLSLIIGAQFDEITIIKIVMLKALQEHPHTILNDADYFLRFVEVANGNVADPHHHDIPSSLELVWAFHELWKILGKDQVPTNNCLSNVTRYILNDEGHGEAYCPCLSLYSGRPLVTNEKSKASTEYVKYMESK